MTILNQMAALLTQARSETLKRPGGGQYFLALCVVFHTSTQPCSHVSCSQSGVGCGCSKDAACPPGTASEIFFRAQSILAVAELWIQGRSEQQAGQEARAQ